MKIAFVCYLYVSVNKKNFEFKMRCWVFVFVVLIETSVPLIETDEVARTCNNNICSFIVCHIVRVAS